MGIFDKAENEAENLAQKDPNLADKGMNQVGQEANQMTGDRFGNQINEGVQDAENRFGQQGGNQDPNQGGYQDPNQVLQSPFHAECFGAACCVIAGHTAGVTARDEIGRLFPAGPRLAGVQRGAAVARSWILWKNKRWPRPQWPA